MNSSAPVLHKSLLNRYLQFSHLRFCHATPPRCPDNDDIHRAGSIRNSIASDKESSNLCHGLLCVGNWMVGATSSLAGASATTQSQLLMSAARCQKGCQWRELLT